MSKEALTNGENWSHLWAGVLSDSPYLIPMVLFYIIFLSMRRGRFRTLSIFLKIAFTLSILFALIGSALVFFDFQSVDNYIPGLGIKYLVGAAYMAAFSRLAENVEKY